MSPAAQKASPGVSFNVYFCVVGGAILDQDPSWSSARADVIAVDICTGT